MNVSERYIKKCCSLRSKSFSTIIHNKHTNDRVTIWRKYYYSSVLACFFHRYSQKIAVRIASKVILVLIAKKCAKTIPVNPKKKIVARFKIQRRLKKLTDLQMATLSSSVVRFVKKTVREISSAIIFARQMMIAKNKREQWVAAALDSVDEIWR